MGDDFPGSADHGVWGLPTAHYTPVAQRHEPHDPSDWARETRGLPPGDNEDFWEKWDQKKDEPSEKK